MNKGKKNFQRTVWDFYHTHKRELPWRETVDPYAILVSEVMLQQTQVKRVIPKYEEWLITFPSFESVASAALSDVLSLWKGLGYNRRALNFKKCAELIVSTHESRLPKSEKELHALPGIGPYTAGALRAFAWNEPVVMCETNIRTVFLHHFFKERENVHDSEITAIIEKTLDRENPREWYWALMDYGAYLKKEYGNSNKRSKHYTKQSRFKGSRRELRSHILSHILEHPDVTKETLQKKFSSKKYSIPEIVNELEREGFITTENDVVSVA